MKKDGERERERTKIFKKLYFPGRRGIETATKMKSGKTLGRKEIREKKMGRAGNREVGGGSRRN